MDFAELPNSEYLLIITDDYSRYPVVETVKSTSANTVIPRVDKVFSEFGIPDVVKTDNGPPFNSREFQSFAQTLGFKHQKITPRWPRANGEVERFVRTIKKVVKTATVEHKNWKQEIASFPQKLQSNSSHDDKNSPSNRIVWSGTKNEVTRVEKDFARPSS
jgi:transposase InsO family protein